MNFTGTHSETVNIVETTHIEHNSNNTKFLVPLRVVINNLETIDDSDSDKTTINN